MQKPKKCLLAFFSSFLSFSVSFGTVLCHAGYLYQNYLKYHVDYLVPEGEIVYAVADLNLRDVPDGNVTGTMEKGTATRLYEYSEDTVWARTDNGWCYSGYLSQSFPAFPEIKYDGDEGRNYIGFLNSEIACIPEEILDALWEEGYEILITDSDLGKDDLYSDGTEYEESTGITLMSDNFCKSYIEADAFAVRYSAVHEIGHAFDWLLGYPSFSDEFQHCFEEEKYYADTGHHMENVQEYFASAFYDYFTEGKSAFKDKEATYEFMDVLITSFCEGRIVVEENKVCILEPEDIETGGTS